MEILKFIFILGINFSIFGFIWGIFMLFVRMLNPNKQQSNFSIDYVLRIVKYFLLVSVTANYIVKFQTLENSEQVSMMHLFVGTFVLFLYLLGKLQNRAVLSQLSQHPMFSRLISKVDPKVERFLLLGSVIYFVCCLFYPDMVDNGLINWFNDSILDIYETPVIGWIFSVIAFFFLINIIMRASNVIGNLISGKSITESHVKTEFKFKQRNYNEQDNDGFTSYEDVTEEDEDKDKKIQ